MKKKLFLSTLLTLVLTGCATNNEIVSSRRDTAAAGQKSSWDSSFGGVDKSYDAELLQLRELIAPRFQTLQFDDKVTGKTMTYNLYIPKDYYPGKNYPLALFMADGSTTGKGAEAPLKQGYGGFIWATDESQAKNPCFVLVPAYVGPEHVVNDDWEVSDEVDMTLRLLEQIVDQYSVDKDRIYTTGQSMGGMISFYLNANHPDLFTASIFVGSQWDINVLEPLADMKFFYIVSSGDLKASKGMQELGDMLQRKGVTFGTTEFAANLSDSEKEKRVRNLINEGHSINFVRFTKGTVIPESLQGTGSEHMYSFDYAYKLESVRNWLFQQTKGTSAK